LNDLLSAFPQEIHSGGLLVPLAEAEAIYKRQGIDRHFLEKEDVIEFSDSTVYAISNQWGKGNIEKFIKQAETLNYKIEETNS
jgi:hypothetical protein